MIDGVKYRSLRPLKSLPALEPEQIDLQAAAIASRRRIVASSEVAHALSVLSQASLYRLKRSVQSAGSHQTIDLLLASARTLLRNSLN
jgi:hypothetical protein